MAWGSSEQFAVYAFDIDTVFNAVVRGAQSLSYKITFADPQTHTVKFDIFNSIFTWGETMTVNLYTINGGRTSVVFNSKSNLGTEIAANSKNKENINKLLGAIPRFLPQVNTDQQLNVPK